MNSLPTGQRGIGRPGTGSRAWWRISGHG